MTLIHQIRDEISTALTRVFQEDYYVKRAIMTSLKDHKDWDDETKRFFSDTVYDIVRYWRTLWYLLDKEPIFDKRDLFNLIQMYVYYKEKHLYDKEGNRHIDDHEFEKMLRRIQASRVLRESIPDWLDELGANEFGKRWDSLIKALNHRPHTIIRANTLKTSRDSLKSILENKGIHVKTDKHSPDALIITSRVNIFDLLEFKEGLFEMQNDASQMVSHFLNPQPGMRAIDVCAGEGGKSIHIAALMKNKGKIIAMDTKEWKLKELRKRATKAGVENIETRFIDSSKAYKRLKGTAERVLLDVPCSGLGTLRRNPDIKWKLTSEDLKRLQALQKDLLERYHPLVKEKGRLVYSVCSILPSEGEQQIRTFLDAHPDTFKLLMEKRYFPDTDDTDGFYMALLERV